MIATRPLIIFLFIVGISISLKGQTLNPDTIYHKESGEKIYHHKEVDKSASFPGGEEGFRKFLSKNIIMPDDKTNNTGIVYASFIVEKDGKISDIKIIKGVSTFCDNEVIRLISKMPDFIPAQKNLENVRVQWNLPIKFSP